MKDDFIPVFITILIAIVFIIIATPYNLGVSPDSVSYLEVAKNISEGKGIVDNTGKLVNHWPPGYPILLGLYSFIVGMHPIDTGIYLNYLLIIILGLSFIAILNQLNLDRRIVNALLFLLLISLPLTVSLMFWSELPFLTFFMITLHFFVKWITHDKFKYILWAGFFSGIFFITRYAGIGFIGGFILYILLAKGAFYRKLKNLIIYISPILLITLTWVIYANSLGQPGMNREIVFHVIDWYQIKNSFIAMGSWFVGDNLTNRLISTPLFIASMLIIFVILKKHFSQFKLYLRKYHTFVGLSLLLMLSYYGFIVFSISIFDAATNMYNRILSPLFPVIIIFLGILMNFFISLPNYKKHVYILLFLFLFMIPFSSFSSWKSHYLYGKGYTGKEFQDSEATQYIAALNRRLITYTNSSDLITFYAGEISQEIPRKRDPFSKQNNTHYFDDINEMKIAIQRGKAQILYFNKISQRFYQMPRKDILKEFKEFDIKYFNDGFLISRPTSNKD